MLPLATAAAAAATGAAAAAAAAAAGCTLLEQPFWLPASLAQRT